MKRSKLVSNSVLAALVSGLSTSANAVMDGPEMEKASDVSSFELVHATGYGLVGGTTGLLSLAFFLDAGEFTRSERVIMFEAQGFAQKSWKNIGSDLRSFENGIENTNRGDVGAVRVTVEAMSDQPALEWVMVQHHERATLAKEQLEATARGFGTDTSQRLERTMKSIEAVLENSEYPLVEVTRTRLIDDIANVFEKANETRLMEMRASVGPAAADYLKQRHAVIAINRPRARVPAVLVNQIEAMKQPASVVFTGSNLENPENMKAFLGGRTIRSVEVMSVDEYQTVLRQLERVQKIRPQDARTRGLKKFYGGATGVLALVFGGVVLTKIEAVAKSEARKGWAPKQAPVK